MKTKPALSFTLLFLSFLVASPCWSQSSSPATWQGQFQGLVEGMPRVQAEKEIERVRRVKSTYELYAMDTSAVCAYKLDEKTILLVTYRPGTPAAHVTQGAGRAPVDGVLIRYEVISLR